MRTEPSTSSVDQDSDRRVRIPSGSFSRSRDNIQETASFMAEQLCWGFRHHDQRNRQKAIAAFADVDLLQFPHLAKEKARSAAVAYVDALWAKDRVEISSFKKGNIDKENLEQANWDPVEEAFARRAEAAGIDARYAKYSTIAWRNHKVGEDYWTPIQKAQVFELRAALQNPSYPEKPKHGEHGFGPEAARYALGVELHDMHNEQHWEQARRVMIPYYKRILRGHNDRN